MSAWLRKLQLKAVGYPGGSEADVTTQSGLHSLAVCLEDTRIRALPPVEREPLRQEAPTSAESSDFSPLPAHLQKYLQELGFPAASPASAETRNAAASFLLSQAVSLHFLDSAPSCRAARSASSFSSSPGPAPFTDALDSHTLSRILSVAHKAGCSTTRSRSDRSNSSNNTLAAARSLSLTIRQHLAPDVLSAAWKPVSDRTSLEELPLGFSMEGASSAAVSTARVLRLLYINDLRELQTSVDRLIVSAQEVSADPQTNSRLGKVGK
jgi:RLL motif-containing protein 1